MIYQSNLFEVQQGIVRLTLNRPDKRNILMAAMHGEIRAALRAKADQSVRVLVLTGAERVFCYGQDLLEQTVTPKTDALVDHFTQALTVGWARIKQVLYASVANTLAHTFDLECDLLRELGSTHDCRESVAAFIEPHPQQFSKD
ncbi:MAG: hypothetical protein HHJ12_08555 [Glaciimonas sp.]|nr:hypothetical protein [Glaciimonas sp.]